MAYDEELADRVRGALSTEHEAIKMFGGVGFMVNTHMAVGISSKGQIMLRFGKEGYDSALARGAEPMTMGERTMTGMVSLPGADLSDEALKAWVDEAVVYALSLPPKKPKKKSSR